MPHQRFSGACFLALAVSPKESAGWAVCGVIPIFIGGAISYFIWR